MLAHKFDIGVIVFFRPISKWLPRENYEVVRQLPPGDDGNLQYRLKSHLSGQERVAPEAQLQLRSESQNGRYAA
jgi:hypothetical protein